MSEEHVVVGVDGSPGSRAALRWALRYAEKVGGRVTAVAAWQPPVYGDVVVPLVLDDLGDRVEHELRKTVDETKALLGTGTRVGQEVVQGAAAKVLLDAASDADLLVVGSRGHGGFVGALIGSVSRACVHHSPCPVVVVRHAEE